ncbi:MAG: T9SS type A sorting domain-containing protein [Bacteroidaceae bacterium]|nr:T9SS type A sorting domain-containing protein [Bacteroidaceae bacterium]
MKKIFLSVFLAAAALNATADDYQYLTAAYNGQEQSFELAAIKKITFEGGNVVLTTTSGSVSLPQSEMERMFFSPTATAIESLPSQTKGLAVKGGLLCAEGDGLLHIYSAGGTLMHMAKVDGDARFSLNNLPKGIYIATLGQRTIKFMK